MTQTEKNIAIIDAFSDVRFDNPSYPHQPGTVNCCGQLVVQRNGVMCCDVCGAKVALEL